MALVTQTPYIEITAGVCGGRARIAGHRIRVQDIVVWTDLGDSPDDIVARFPQLSLAKVHAALSYYHDHRAQIEAEIRADDALVATLRAEAGPGFFDRLRESHDADSIPPG